jgi:hypothetical protein
MTDIESAAAVYSEEPKNAVAPTSEMDQSFNRINERLSELMDLIGSLGHRLEPVLEHPVPTEVGDGLARETRPPVIEKLAVVEDQVVEAVTRVQQLRHRLVI